MFDLAHLGGRPTFDALIDAVLEAGEIALTLYRGGAASRAEKKPDRSPVTEADRAVEEHLLRFVRERFPAASFFGEETGGQNQRVPGVRFVVDPIDGTRAFMRGMPTWSILVGIEHEGEPVGAVAYLPAARSLFTGLTGHGAYHDGRPCRVSAVERLADAMICHGGLGQFTDEGIEAVLPRLARKSYTQRGLGDFAGYAALLAGEADGVIDPYIKPYDIAPAAVLVREAGGRFTDQHGVDTIYSSTAVASNGRIHDELLAVLRD
jgi:histidinol phosphatase-like enzyme (inositol monophosphatase family)